MHGFDRASAREPVASIFYAHQHQIARDQHAVDRSRQLLATALGYPVPASEPDYGIEVPGFDQQREKKVVLVPNASVERKLWAQNNWVELGRKFVAAGLAVEVTWGNDAELTRATAIAADCGGQPTAPLDLPGLAQLFDTASAMVSLDTGLSHLAAARGLPNVCICVASDPRRSGALGRFQQAVSAAEVTSEQVYTLVNEQLTSYRAAV